MKRIMAALDGLSEILECMEGDNEHAHDRRFLEQAIQNIDESSQDPVPTLSRLRRHADTVFVKESVDQLISSVSALH